MLTQYQKKKKENDKSTEIKLKVTEDFNLTVREFKNSCHEEIQQENTKRQLNQ